MAKSTPYLSCHRDNFQAKEPGPVAGWLRQVTQPPFIAGPLAHSFQTMKNLLIILSFVWLLASCDYSNYKILDTLSLDSLYIYKNVGWNEPDTILNGISSGSDSIIGVSPIDLIIIEKNTFVFIKTNSMKTADDSIHLFWPPEYGGTICLGYLSPDSIIKSKAFSINNTEIKKLNHKYYRFKNNKFEFIQKTNLNWLKEVIKKYTFRITQDSLRIIISGP